MKNKCKHNWTEWGEVYTREGSVSHYAPDFGPFTGFSKTTGEYQKRTCTKCGMVEEHCISWRYV